VLGASTSHYIDAGTSHAFSQQILHINELVSQQMLRRNKLVSHVMLRYQFNICMLLTQTRMHENK
jgi:hypothetical protein